MNIVKRISSIEPKITIAEDGVAIAASISFLGKKYNGMAVLHPDDLEFQSKYIGASIAHLRALRKCFKSLAEDYKKEYILIKDMLGAAKQSKELENVQKFLIHRMWKSYNKFQKLKDAEKEAAQSLKDYIKSQEKVFNTIRNLRAKQDKN
jgi:hypothetical protein